MNTAPASTKSPERADPQDQPAAEVRTRSGRLLALVHKLIEFGKALIATALAPSDEDARSSLPLRFGTFNLALIIARITRGLRLAEALEARLIRNASRLDNPPARKVAVATTVALATTPPPKRDRKPPTPTLTPEADDGALLARLPSAKAIAEQVLRRPIGAVLNDICRDLGIDCSHPLWGEIRLAVLGHGGDLKRNLNGVIARNRAVQAMLPGLGELSALLPVAMAWTPDFAAPALASGTGPP